MSETTGAIPANRMVSFSEAFPLFLKNYAVFQGRSSRGAFWWASLALFIISFAVAIVDSVLFSSFVAATKGNGPLGTILSLATLLPGLGLSIRRLHDVGRSGWWVLITFTIIGILLLIYWYVQPGQRQQNVFGPDSEAGR